MMIIQGFTVKPNRQFCSDMWVVHGYVNKIALETNLELALTVALCKKLVIGKKAGKKPGSMP
jgi:hypothetical protein